MNDGKALDEFDLFVSYAHVDDHDGWVTALVDAIKRDHASFTPRPLRVFFDREAIKTMQDWEHRILAGLRSSKVMLAVLSPAYFQSEYCRKEWEVYIDHELGIAMPGQGIAPIYSISVPGFLDGAEEQLDDWQKNLKRRQFVDLRPWRMDGVEALQHNDVRERLEELEEQITERLDRAARVSASPTTVPPHNENFVGRVEDLRNLRRTLAMGKVGAVTAVHGIGGIGKSAMAFEYAHAYADDYEGGRFLLPCANQSDLAMVLVGLAPQLDLDLSNNERKDIALALSRVRRELEKRPRSLLILDNVDDPDMLAPAACAKVLPHSDRVHVLATTRRAPDELPGVSCLALDALPVADALRLFEKYRPPTDDDEWKAAHRIAKRLGGHALSCEVVAVYLWQNPEVSYRGFLQWMLDEGLLALEGAGQDELVKLSRHEEKLIGPLIGPTLDSLNVAEESALAFAALLPPDQVPFPWLGALVKMEHAELFDGNSPGRPHVWQRAKRRLIGLRLLTPANEGPCGRMPRLIQAVVHDRMNPDAKALRIRALYAFLRHMIRGEAVPRLQYYSDEPGWEIDAAVQTILRFGEFDRDAAVHLVGIVHREWEGVRVFPPHCFRLLEFALGLKPSLDRYEENALLYYKYGMSHTDDAERTLDNALNYACTLVEEGSTAPKVLVPSLNDLADLATKMRRPKIAEAFTELAAKMDTE